MDITNVAIDVKHTIGARQLYKASRPRFEYINNERSNNVIGQTYDLICPENGYEIIRITVPGDKQVDTSNIIGNPPVILDGVNLRITWYNGTDHVQGSAEAIRFAENSSKP